ncbi:RloB-like protein [Alteromonadaceae bacterium 2753L.S.0a.02]|nr:RloB-like protein [Alteromonadaceae bacterium 2753L.S.0a.02]
MPKKRPRPVRQPKAVMHIYCEGEKTEPNYINGYINSKHQGNRRLKIIRIEKTQKNTPIQLVEEALKQQKSRSIPEEDIFWVVYDRESNQKYSDDLHKKAYEKAGSRLKIAISNVCFEIWILLHFQEVTAPYMNYEDLYRNSQLCNHLKNIGFKKYEKSAASLYPLLDKKVDDAKIRAEKMNDAAKNSSGINDPKPYQLNPFTDLHKLLDAIDDFMNKNK